MHDIAVAAFCASLAFLIYVLFLYPVLLHVLSTYAARPVRKSWMPRTVSILLPVRNGERWIAQKLDSIRQLDYPSDLMQIVVVDDGSIDRTVELVERAAIPGLELVAVTRRGKAASLNAGLARARGEIVLFTDVRQCLEPRCLRSLVECMGDPEVGVASGELVIRSGQSQQEADVGLYWRYEKWIRRNLSRLHSVPGATGCLYAMRRELVVPLPPDTLLDDVYLPLAAFFRGYRIIFDESAKAYDFPTALGPEFRRKVRTQAGVLQILAAYPQLLLPTGRMWLHFASHKVARLVLPYAMLVLAVSSAGLPGAWAPVMLGGQILFYGLALVDNVIPAGSVLKRASSLARTFVVLVGAALCAPAFLVANRRTLGWSATEVATAIERKDLS